MQWSLRVNQRSEIPRLAKVASWMCSHPPVLPNDHPCLCQGRMELKSMALPRLTKSGIEKVRGRQVVAEHTYSKPRKFIPNTWNQGGLSKTMTKKKTVPILFWSNEEQSRDKWKFFPYCILSLLFAHFLAYLVTTLLGFQCLPQFKCSLRKSTHLTMEMNISSPGNLIQKHCVLRDRKSVV